MFVCSVVAPPEWVSLGKTVMNRVIEKLEESQLRKDLPVLRPGDTVRVHVRLKEREGEKEKERIQPYEGVVIAQRGRLASRSVTIRRVSFGVGVERIFPINSPSIQSIEVVRSGKVRRAKLYYLRGLKGKSARLKRMDRVEAAAPITETAE